VKLQEVKKLVVKFFAQWNEVIMSRLGKTPIQLSNNVDIKLSPERVLTVKGPKGELTLELMHGIDIEKNESELLVKNESTTDAFHGLYRSLIKNMILGVTLGFQKKLTLIGVGFRAAVTGNKLNLQLGFSHPTEIELPKGIQVAVDKNVNIIITGIDTQLVGQFASEIRALRPPEPYKGKGIRYENEYVRKKAGKSAKSK